MAKLGFLGLGIMGAPMALRLIEAGHELAVWSRDSEKARRFAGINNAIHSATPRDVVSHADCIFLCVGDTGMSRQVIEGENGLASGAKPGLIIVDCSTISPTESSQMALQLESKQIDFLDAPCSGSKAGAEGGTLTFMVGGHEHVFNKVRPYFNAMGKLLFHCGPHGMGLRAKLTQNLILGNLLQAFNEGLVLSTKAGVDPRIMLDILNNSAARSGLVSAKAPAVFRRDFTTNFSAKWLEKDLNLAVNFAGELGVPVPVTALSQQMLRVAVVQGYGDEDICGSIRVYEDLAGVQVQSADPSRPLSSH